MEVTFWVPGIPKPGGSKTAFRNKYSGKTAVVDSCKGSKGWKSTVAVAAAPHFRKPLEGALELFITFQFLRPQGHFGSGRNSGVLKSSAPQNNTVRPDATKLLRSTEDALKGIAWRDDAQVVHQEVWKEYGEKAGALITVRGKNT